MMTYFIQRASLKVALLASISTGSVIGCAIGCSTSVTQESSATHFLDECTSSCPDGLSCIGGVCTLQCLGAADCTKVSSLATCMPASSGLGTSVCGVACGADADCSPFTGAARCVSGSCRPVSADASTLTDGAPGTGGVQGSGGTGSGGSGTGGSGGVDSGALLCGLPSGPDGPGAPCQRSSYSTLDGVETVLLPSKCTYTVAEATAGVSVPFVVVVRDTVPHFLATPLDSGGCSQPDTTGFETFVEVTSIADDGGGQRYCQCDIGLCHDPIALPVDLTPGCRNGTVRWEGVNWTGPSDFGNPKGAPFSPGQYVLTVRQAGRIPAEGGTRDVMLEARMMITITP